MADFTTPEFLLNHSTNEIHQKMKDILPADLDVSEGSHTWNYTRPTALVAAEICQFILPEVIKLIFPEWSYGQFVDAHAKTRGMARRAAVAATGTITITGVANTVIPAGSMFSTASINETPSVDYLTTEDAIIPASGEVEVPVQCTQLGIIGNTTANTVIFVGNKLIGVTAVTNEEDITGGTEVESDASLIERIVEYDKTQGESFVGNPADYKRWALSVPGVGGAIIISATDDSGLVTIIITDSNGAPGNPELCEAVYNYIMRPDDPGLRRAPVNALLSVIPPETLDIVVQATVELEEGYELETVKENYLEKLALYLPVAMEEQEIKYTRVCAELSDTEGVNDFSDLKMCVKSSGVPGTSNIPITIEQLPLLDPEDITFTEGSVP